MNERNVSLSSHRRRGRSRAWTVLLLLTTGGAARAQQEFEPIPPTLLINNYDRVYPGLLEALRASR